MSKQIEDIYPLTPVQEGMLFHTLYAPEYDPYVMQVFGQLVGAVNEAAFRHAWNDVSARHAVLRSSFVWAGLERPLQVVRERVDVPYEYFDWSELDQQQQQQRLKEYQRGERERGFELQRAPLQRVSLVRLGEGDYLLSWSFHHLLLDGWSFPLVFEEVFRLYEAAQRGETAKLEPVRPYRDYISWLSRQDLEQARRYWEAQLRGVHGPTRLGVEREAVGEPGVDDYQNEQVVLGGELSEQLQQLGREQQLTLNTIVQGAWAVLLSRYSGERQVVFGVTVSGRPAELRGVERMVGLFINSLPLVVQVQEQQRVSEWLRELQQQVVELRQYEYTPLVELQKWSELPAGTPLFENLMVFENYPVKIGKGRTANRDGRMRVGRLNSQESTNYPLTLLIAPRSEVTLELSYDRRHFEAATVARMLGHLQQLLASIGADPQQAVARLELLPVAEAEQLVVARNQTRREYREDKCLAALFEEQVVAHPETIAVRDADVALSYDELNRCANRVARTLCAEGVGPEAIVGLMCERSAQFLIGMLGVFKAGGAYLPLAEQQPSGRLQEQLRQSGARVVLVSRQQAGRMQQMLEQWSESPQVLVLEEVLSASGDEQNLEVVVGRRNLAYVIYTSGSTGEPKGVMIEQGGMLNHLWAKIEDLGLRAEDVVAQTAAVSFDISVWQYLAAVMVGGRVEVLREEAKLLRAVSERGVTVLETVPALLRASLDASAAMALPALRWLVVTGEARSSELCVQGLQRFPAIAMVNAYGPTECSDDVTHSFIRSEAESGSGWATLGSAVGNTRLYVLDEAQRVVPIGVRGELYVGGAGVGRGYLKRAEITAEKFVPDPFSEVGGERLYRTGDVVRWGSDGELEFIGRVDEQVKVRGVPIEVGEIEVALKEHEIISDWVVVAQEDETGKRLVAYVVWNGAELSSSELRQYLKERLPEYMVPAVFVSLEQLPLTVNGKVDRKALPAAELSAVREEYVGPRNAVEEELCRIWTEVLKVERVGIEDNFFELGGDSILSIQIIARAAQAGLQLTPRQLFEQQTIRALAEVVGSREGVQAEQGLVSGSVALTPIQHYFFEQELVERDHYNQALLLELPAETDVELVREVMKRLVLRHDALRLRFREQEGEWRQSYAGAEAAEQDYFEVVDLSGVAERSRELTRRCGEMQQRLNIGTGPLLRVGYFGLGAGERKRLLLAIHHLAVDGVSWRILVEELQAGYAALARGVEAEWGAKTSSYQQWAAALVEYAQRVEAEQSEYWERVWDGATGRVPRELEGANTIHSEASVRGRLSAEETRALLQEVAGVYHTQINDVLLTALGRVLGEWVGSERVIVGLEGHGREQEEVGGVDVTQTVGWFTSLYPAVIEVRRGSEVGEALRSVKEQLRGIPGKGVGYGALRYLGSTEVRERLRQREQMEVSFNYLGQFDYFDHATDTQVDGSEWRGARESSGSDQSLQNTRGFVIEIVGNVVGGQLHFLWHYSSNINRRETVQSIAESFVNYLRELIHHCQDGDVERYVAGDFPLAGVNQQQLELLLGQLNSET